jgi:hypothetical protein
MREFVTELVRTLFRRKRLWLVPTIIAIVILIAMILASEQSRMAPF